MNNHHPAARKTPAVWWHIVIVVVTGVALLALYVTFLCYVVFWSLVLNAFETQGIG